MSASHPSQLSHGSASSDLCVCVCVCRCRTGGRFPQHTDSCLPDLLSLLQVLLYFSLSPDFPRRRHATRRSFTVPCVCIGGHADFLHLWPLVLNFTFSSPSVKTHTFKGALSSFLLLITKAGVSNLRLHNSLQHLSHRLLIKPKLFSRTFFRQV